MLFRSWVRKIPWRRAWQPTPVFLPGESHGQRSLMGYSPQGHKELNMTEVTQHTCIKCQTKPEFLNLGNINFWVQIILCGGELSHALQDVQQHDFHPLDANNTPPGIVATKSLLILPHVPGVWWGAFNCLYSPEYSLEGLKLKLTILRPPDVKN